MIAFIKKYIHAIPILVYLVIYMTCFILVERIPRESYTILHTAFDDRIPFCEYFIIPYLLWFVYVTLFFVIFIFWDKDSYCKMFTTMTIGMTIFIIVSAIWPNAHDLREQAALALEAKDTVFTRLVVRLYGTDTATNLLPSIHVYNSLAVQFAIFHSPVMKKHRWVAPTTGLLCVLIILSTMFVKQHSVIDVVAAIALYALMYFLVYRRGLNFFELARKHKEKRRAAASRTE